MIIPLLIVNGSHLTIIVFATVFYSTNSVVVAAEYRFDRNFIQPVNYAYRPFPSEQLKVKRLELPLNSYSQYGQFVFNEPPQMDATWLLTNEKENGKQQHTNTNVYFPNEKETDAKISTNSNNFYGINQMLPLSQSTPYHTGQYSGNVFNVGVVVVLKAVILTKELSIILLK